MIQQAITAKKWSSLKVECMNIMTTPNPDIFEVYEKHDENCGGDIFTSPMLMTVKLDAKGNITKSDAEEDSSGGCKLETAPEHGFGFPCPKELKAVLERADNCEHFAGEEAYDNERRDYLNKQFAELKCESVDAEKAALIKKYNDEPTLAFIREYESYKAALYK